MVLSLTGFILYNRFFSGDEESLVLSGTVECHDIRIGSKIGGRIAEVLVDEGRQVDVGQVILRFEVYDLEARRNQAQAAVKQAEANLHKLRRGFRKEEIDQARAAAETARAQLEMLRNGPRPQEIDQARADVAATEADSQNALLSYHRIVALFERQVVSRQEYDNTKTRLDQATARRDASRKRLELLLAGTRKEEIEAAEKRAAEAQARLELFERGHREEDIEAAEAALEQATAALQAVETQLAEIEVKAPAKAVVEVIDVRPGDLIPPNSPIATLLEPDQLYVRVYVPEPSLGRVQLGKPVEIKVDSFPTRSFPGTIEQIATQGEFTPRNVQTREERANQVFAVKVKITNREGSLRAGMAADVIIK
jgi:multidrug resistance efflux pump